MKPRTPLFLISARRRYFVFRRRHHFRARALMIGRVRVRAAAVIALAIAAGALAYFTQTGSGLATGGIGSINAPSGVTALRSGPDVAVGWDAATLSSGGSVEGYYVKRSDGATICGVPTLVTGLSCTDATVTPGTYTYTVTAVYHGWTASAISNSITITLTAPTLSSTPSNPSANAFPSFSFSGGGGGGYECQLDGGSFTSCTSPQPYSGLSDGPHTFKVHAVLNGVSGPDSSYTWTIDTSAPSITAEPGNPSASSSASFSFTHAQPAYAFRCQLDNGGFTSCASPKSYSGLGDGSHTFEVEAVSADGATTPTASYTWLIDTVAPTTSITFPAPGGNYNSAGWNGGCGGSICGTASDSGSGVQEVLVSIQQGSGNYWNGTSFGSPSEDRLTASGTTSWTLAFSAGDFPANGGYTVRVYGVDNAGNTQSVATSATFTIDNTAPIVTLTQVNGSTVTFPDSLSLPVTSIGGACGTASGDSSSVSWSVTGSASASGSATCSSGSWTATLTSPLQAGNYTAAATQTDAAGNTGSSGNKSITVNATTVSKAAAGTYTLTVPAHVTSVSFTLKGAGGAGGAGGAAGAAGGSSSGTFSVPNSGSQTQFTVVVGGAGSSGGSGGTSGTGCAGGGGGGSPGLLGGRGGGGGGATCMYPSGSASSLIAVAGGGGGGGGASGTGVGGAGGGGPSANPGANVAGSGGGGTNGGGGGSATTLGSFPFSLSLTSGSGGGNGSDGGICSGGTCGAGGSGGGVLLLAGAGGGGGGGIASGGGGGGALTLFPGAGGGGGAGYNGGVTNYPVTISSASNGGGGAGGGAGATGTAGSVSFTAAGITLP